MKIIFVCTGNTCRSPMAEAIARQKIKLAGLDKIIKIESAGINVAQGDIINEKAKTALKKLGIKITNRKAKKLKMNNLDKYKLIITMTEGQKKLINSKNCFSIADFCGNEICDPFGQSQEVYDLTAHQISSAISIIFNKILGDKK